MNNIFNNYFDEKKNSNEEIKFNNNEKKNFDEESNFYENNNNIFSRFEFFSDDENSLGKKSDFSYDLEEYYIKNESLKDNLFDSFSGEITDNLYINNSNKNTMGLKKNMPFVNSISNAKTNFITNKTNKELIFNITKEKKKTQLGRKKKYNLGGKHNKFSLDNIARKIKSKLFEYILLLINSSIKIEIKENEENELKCSKFLLKIDQEVIKDINTNNNKMLLKTKLKDIFYLNNVSKKYINYGLDYNKKIIENIYKYNTQKKTISILEKTFYECLEQFRGSMFYEELDGLEKEFINVIKEFKNKGETEEYINNFKNLVNTYEKYFEEKISRKKRKH